jgi:uncharacterized BrkB/YihY/UPF0761 family membrane protein
VPAACGGHRLPVLFSIVPLAIVIVSIFGLVLGNQEVNDVVVDTITRALPSTAASRQDVADAITAIASPSGVLGLITLVLFAWAATGMMASIRAGLEVAFHVEHSRPMARGKLVDLALVVGTAVLVLGMAGLTLLDRLAQHTLRRADSATGLQETQLGTIIPARWRWPCRWGSSCCCTGSSPVAGSVSVTRSPARSQPRSSCSSSRSPRAGSTTT